MYVAIYVTRSTCSQMLILNRNVVNSQSLFYTLQIIPEKFFKANISSVLKLNFYLYKNTQFINFEFGPSIYNPDNSCWQQPLEDIEECFVSLNNTRIPAPGFACEYIRTI